MIRDDLEPTADRLRRTLDAAGNLPVDMERGLRDLGTRLDRPMVVPIDRSDAADRRRRRALAVAAVVLLFLGAATAAVLTAGDRDQVRTGPSSTTTDASTPTTDPSPSTTEQRTTSTSLAPSTTAPPASTTAATVPTPATTAVPTTAVPAATSPAWEEFANAAIPGFCWHPPATLVDGADPAPEAGRGYFRLWRTIPSTGATAILPDVPSPAGPLTAVVAACNAGGVSWPNQVLFFGPGGAYVAGTDLMDPDPTGATSGDQSFPWEQAWTDEGMYAPARQGIQSMMLDGDEVVFDVLASGPEDAGCCPTMRATVRVRVPGPEVQLVSVTRR